MKKLALLALLLIGVPVLSVGVALGAAFVGNAPLVPGRTLADGKVVTVVDGYVACFLVDAGGGRWILVDACQDPQANGILAALRERGATADDVGLILLTHGHPDHRGGVAAFPRAEVRGLADEAPLLEGRAPRKSPIARLVGVDDSGVRLTAPVVDGERLRHGDVEVEVFAVPGHTPGSAVYLVNGTLFFGDAARLASDGRVKNAPWFFSEDLDENGRSLIALYNRLRTRRDIRHLAFAHTGAADGMAAFKAFTP